MRTLTLIQEIFAQPTAPFREGWVLSKVREILEEHRIPYFSDKYGNIIAGVSSAKSVRRAKIAYMAHTDHPGFHITKKIDKKNYEAIWYGGAPFKQMKNSRVAIYDPLLPEQKFSGRISFIKNIDYTREGLPLRIRLDKAADLNTSCFGAFDLPAYKLKGDRIETRVADDLTGVVIILGMLIDLLKTPSAKRSQILGVFTRGEEVGYIGCWSLLAEKILPAGLSVVSLEASRTLPGAEIGQGPVLRIGDRSTLFDSEFSIFLWECAQKLAKVKKNFLYQRRLMDGGSCEATALGLFDCKVTGIAVPLGNYHNQGPKGPAGEIVSLADVDRARLLCTELSKSYVTVSEDLRRKRKKNLARNYRQLKPLLTQKVTFI